MIAAATKWRWKSVVPSVGKKSKGVFGRPSFYCAVQQRSLYPRVATSQRRPGDCTPRDHFMRNISDTIRRLRAHLSMPQGSVANRTDRLTDLPDFGTNPGMLRARIYVPANLADNAPLVVVLHGCTQSAAGYDQGSGWSALADLHGFAVLFPEQQRANNANLCFNWFVPEDTRRDSGEALSIRQMVEAMVVAHGIDRRRIFVTGLSAGGAMASVMLATYPDVFAGGAIIAGLPYGSAATIPEAFDRMRGHGGPSDQALQTLLRGASDHDGPWPTISVWHGTADLTVNSPTRTASSRNGAASIVCQRSRPIPRLRVGMAIRSGATHQAVR